MFEAALHMFLKKSAHRQTTTTAPEAQGRQNPLASFFSLIEGMRMRFLKNGTSPPTCSGTVPPSRVWHRRRRVCFPHKTGRGWRGGAFGARAVTYRDLLGEGQRDEQERQPDGDAGDQLVDGQLEPQPLVLALRRRLLQQEVREDVLGGDVRDGHFGARLGERAPQASRPTTPQGAASHSGSAPAAATASAAA